MNLMNVGVDPMQLLRQSDDSPQVFHLMVVEQITSRNDSPVFSPDRFAMNFDRQPLSEIRMEEHKVLPAREDRLATIDPVVDSDPVLPFAAVAMGSDASVLQWLHLRLSSKRFLRVARQKANRLSPLTEWISLH